MVGKLIDGKSIAEEIKKKVSEEIESFRKKGIHPCLAVILVGDDPASKVFVASKEKACKEVGIKYEEHQLTEKLSEKELLNLIEKLNKDKKIHGILVQLPLPKHLNEKTVIESISPEKDVDGLTTVNLGKTFAGVEELVPCTPKGIIKLLESLNIDVKGKEVCIVGAGKLVGKPLSVMLLNREATVTVCHIATKNLSHWTKQAEILITGVGKPGLISKEMVKENAIVIDAGTKKKENVLKGDVSEDVREVASFITPVPGGVGPMTVACVLENLIVCVKKQVG